MTIGFSRIFGRTKITLNLISRHILDLVNGGTYLDRRQTEKRRRADLFPARRASNDFIFLYPILSIYRKRENYWNSCSRLKKEGSPIQNEKKKNGRPFAVDHSSFGA